MKTIRVHTAFDFTNPDYSQTHYAAGVHKVDDAVAGHWFTLLHAEIADGGKEEHAEIDALFQAEITALQDQLKEVQGTVAELKKTVAERDKVIAERDGIITALQDQLKEVPAQLTAQAEGAKGGKK